MKQKMVFWIAIIASFFICISTTYASLGDIYYGSTTYGYTTTLPIGSSTNCLTSNGSIPGWSSSCGSGGGGSASAALPFYSLQYSVPSGTSSALGASNLFTASTTTGILSAPAFNASSTLGTSTFNGALNVQGTTTSIGLNISGVAPNSPLQTDAKGNITVCASCISSSSKLIAFTELWIDGNRTDSYTANGSIQYPFTTITAAANYINGSSTIPTAAIHIAPIASTTAPTYNEQSITFNKSVVIYGNNAPILMLNGGNLGGGTLTFNQDFDCNNCTIFGNVIGADTSLTNPHTFENSFISGNLTLDGLAIYSNGTVVDQNKNLFPFLSNSASSTFTVGASSLVDFTGGDLQVVTINNGSLQFDNAGDNVATNTTYAIISTSTNSSLGINGFTLVNTGTGGGVDTNNPNKNTPPDTISSMKFVGGVGSNPPILAGTSTLFLANYTATDVIGDTLYASSTGYLPLNTLGIEVDGNGLYGSGHGLPSAGTSTFAGPIIASSTAQFNGQIIDGTGVSGTSGQVLSSQGSGQPVKWITSSGGSSQWTTVTNGINFSAGFVGIGTSTPSAVIAAMASDTMASSAAGCGDIDFASSSQSNTGTTTELCLSTSGALTTGGAITSGGSVSGNRISLSLSSVALPSVNFGNSSGITGMSTGNVDPAIVVSGATSTIFTSTGVIIGGKTIVPTALLDVIGTSGSTSDVFDVASSTGSRTIGVDSKGHMHVNNGGGVPSVACASTCTIDPNSSDGWGSIAISGVQTAVTLTMANSFNDMACMVGDNSTSGNYELTATTTTQATFSTAVSLGTANIWYNCVDLK